MGFAKVRSRLARLSGAAIVVMLLVSPVFATATAAPTSGKPLIHANHTHSVATLLDSTFDPNAPVGGVPFCKSGSLGTILCYSPSMIETAYNFPADSHENGNSQGGGRLDGAGQTIVLVDAFGSPTIQADLNKFDTAFGLPSATVTILCGPTWTGSASDSCPVKTVAGLFTPPPAGSNADICGGVPGMIGWAEESTLDVTMAHALAPAAKIVLVVGNDCFDSSLYGAELAVVNQQKYKGSVMSQSFGEPDDLVTCTAVDNAGNCIARDPTLLNPPNQVFQIAKENYWTVIASSGDDGANTDARVLGTVELTPSFPSTSPLVLAAGGTEGNPYGGQYGTFPGPGGKLACAAHATCNTGLVVINGGANGCGTAARPGVPSSCFATGYGGEQTWNEFNQFGGLTGSGLGRASGGGISSLYPVPNYQHFLPDSITTLLGDTVPITGRTVPDVSFNSAAQGGWLSYLGFLGVWAVFSGTSASSPAWAGIVALADQANGAPLGFINPAIYGLGISGNFHDITVGENSDTAGPVEVAPGVIINVDGFVAAPGYDLTTGLGTPNVTHVIDGLVSSSNVQGQQGGV